MFVLIDQYQQVHLGPIQWNARIIQNFISDEFGLLVALPSTPQTNVPIIINSTLQILPTKLVYPDTHNPIIEQYAGPFWSVLNNVAIGTYTNIPRPLNSIKNELLTTIAHNRWLKEVSGITLVVQNNTVAISTQRGERDTFFHALQTLDPTAVRTWKFNEIWLTLTSSELRSIVDAIATHVQNAFDWEQAKIAEINAATFDQIANIALT